MPLLLLGAATVGAARKAARGSLKGWMTPAKLAAMLLLAYYLRYFLWKIPRLGPRRDIDLYFEFYLLTPFFLGLALEERTLGVSPSPGQRYVLLSFLTGSALPLCEIMIHKGLPAI